MSNRRGQKLGPQRGNRQRFPYDEPSCRRSIATSLKRPSSRQSRRK